MIKSLKYGDIFLTLPHKTDKINGVIVYIDQIFKSCNENIKGVVIEKGDKEHILFYDKIFKSSTPLKNSISNRNFKIIINGFDIGNVDILLELLKKYNFDGELVFNKTINESSEFEENWTQIDTIP